MFSSLSKKICFCRIKALWKPCVCVFLPVCMYVDRVQTVSTKAEREQLWLELEPARLWATMWVLSIHPRQHEFSALTWATSPAQGLSINYYTLKPRFWLCYVSLRSPRSMYFFGGKYISLSCITETKQLRLHTFIREEGFCLFEIISSLCSGD